MNADDLEKPGRRAQETVEQMMMDLAEIVGKLNSMGELNHALKAQHALVVLSDFEGETPQLEEIELPQANADPTAGGRE